MPERFRPISVDLRGHGESPWDPLGRYDLGDYAQDLPQLLDALEIDRTVVVGHSLGGNVSTLFAAAEPERVLALALVDTGPTLEVRGTAHVLDEVENILRSFSSIDEYVAQLELIHPNGDPAVLRRLAESGVTQRIDGRFEPNLDPGVLVGAGQVELDGNERRYAEEMALLERALWTALRDLRCPVEVIRGELSAVLNEKIASEMVDGTLADGRLVTIPKAGHAIMIDEGAALRCAILDFISRISVRD